MRTIQKSLLLLSTSIICLLGFSTKASLACEPLDCTNWCSTEQVQENQRCFITEEQTNAVEYLYSIGATKYNNLSAFRPTDHISRQEAAKFFNIAYQQLSKNTTWTPCSIKDVSDIDPTLLDSVNDICSQGIMKWSRWYFMPKDSLNMAQALVMVYRMKFQAENENVKPRYKNYNFSNKMSYLDWGVKSIAWRQEWDLEQWKITRWAMAALLHAVLTK